MATTIIKSSIDDNQAAVNSAHELLVSASISGPITVDIPSVSPTGGPVPADADYVGMNVGGILTGLTGTVNGLKIDGSAVTQPISAVSLPLPLGASTSALQTAGNASLSSIDSKFNTLGQKSMAASVPVVIASDQSSLTVIQSLGSNLHVDVDNFPATVAVTQSTSPWIISGTVTADIGTTGGLALDSTLSALSAKFGSLGQKSMAGSAPVVIASDQSAIPVSQSGTWTTGRTWTLLNTTDSVNSVQSGTWNINNISGTISLPTGASTSALQTTGNSSLSSIDSKLNSLGQKTMSASVPVVIASDQSTIPVSVGNFPATVAVTQSTSPWVDNITQFGSNNISTGTGTSGLGIPRVTVSSDSSITNITGTISLPTGASTSANQSTANSSLATIVTNTTGLATSANQTNGLQLSQQVDAAGHVQPAGDIASRAVFFKVTDGTNTASVKAASTAAIATDPALVVAISPNNAVAVTQSTSPWVDNVSQFGGSNVVTGTGNSGAGIPRVTISNDSSITNISGTVSLPTGASTSALQTTGNSSLSSIDGKLNDNYGAASGALRVAAQIGNASAVADFNAGTTTAQTLRVVLPTDQTAIPASQSGTWNVNVSGTVPLPSGAATEATLAKLTLTQASTTSGQSGPLVQGAVTTSDPAYTTAQTDPISLTTTGRLRSDVTGNVASAATDSGNPVKVGGIVNITGSTFSDGQRANMQMNSSGSIHTTNTGRLPSYSAFSSFTTAATATDIFTVTGSASKTVKIRTVVISGSNTGNTNALVIMLKRSTANSGGTSTTLTAVPNDSNNSAATATARSYTVNPTTGTLVGNIEGELIFLPTLASTNSVTNENITFGDDGAQPIVLRGTSEVFALNLNSVALLGTTVMNISINWTEE